MKFKLNPLTGEFDYTSESANKQKLNPLTGEFNLVEGDGPFSQIFNPLNGKFNLGTKGGGGIIAEVTGNGYINLTNAVAHHLMELKAYGGTEQRNLPAGHTQLQYVYMTDGSYIRVEDLPISAGYKVEFDFQTTTMGSSLRNYLGGRANGVSAGGGFRLSKLASSNNSRVVLYGFEAGTEYYDPTVAFQPNTRYKYTYNNGVCTLESGGSVISTNTFTITDNTSTDWGINDYCSNNSWSAYHDGIYVYSVKVWNNQGELVMNLIPDLTSSNVVCFYDMVTGNLREATGGTFTAGPNAVPTPTAPMDIVSNNGVLKFGKQITLNPTRYYAYITTTDKWSYTTDSYSIIIPVTVGQKYRIIADPTTPVNGNVQNTILRWGFVDTVYDDWKTDAELPETMTVPIYDYIRTSPQSAPDSVVTATHPYMVIQMGAAAFLYNMTNGLISVISQEIYTDGTTEKIGLGGTYSTADGQGTFVSPSSATTTRIYKAFGKLAAGTYTVEIDGPFEFIMQYKDKIDTTPTQYGNIDTWTKTGEYEITDDTLYYGVAIRNDSGTGNIRPADFVSGNGKISIKETSGNVVAEILLKIGDYIDEQEILSGNIIRKIGIKVLDGTENWSLLNQANYVYGININNAEGQSSWTEIGGICTHLVWYTGSTPTYTNTPANSLWFNANRDLRVKTNSNFETLNAWKQFLADQYNVGTPVIVVYPLKTPTTETVSGQPLDIPAGNSTIEITQASIDNLPLYAKYLQSN